ncbi:hypothetical protein [Kutzneria buriramensis]|uniref:Uncharacterized protein n=1 Tax=Kutzneria buriramensis TaxID=1045776 RepID=A0A3E0HKF3_9PSEU|nr:hypothetical protein [Kutzneria buriramensis]REH46939.1 hypothetical protein BCF44_106103 [Kutzneria buriramensis]
MDSIFYLGLVLFAVGAWQAIRRYSHSLAIGVILPVYLVGAVLTFAGLGRIGNFVSYLFVAWFVLLQLLVVSSRRKYFFHLVPFAVLYGAAVGFFVKFYALQSFFWPTVALTALFLLVNLVVQLGSKDAVEAHVQLKKAVLAEIKESDIRQKVQKELGHRTLVVQHVVMSVLAFAGACVLVFYLVNGSL